MKTVYAWTDTEYRQYPQFINISVEGNKAHVITRGPDRGVTQGYIRPGDYASMSLPREELIKILEKLIDVSDD